MEGHASVAQPLTSWAVAVVPKVAQSGAAERKAKNMVVQAGTVNAQLATAVS